MSLDIFAVSLINGCKSTKKLIANLDNNKSKVATYCNNRLCNFSSHFAHHTVWHTLPVAYIVLLSFLTLLA